MSSKQYVEITLEAIESVKGNAKKAMEAGDYITYSKLMADLYALEVCLVGTAQKLIDDLNKEAA